MSRASELLKNINLTERASFGKTPSTDGDNWIKYDNVAGIRYVWDGENAGVDIVFHYNKTQKTLFATLPTGVIYRFSSKIRKDTDAFSAANDFFSFFTDNGKSPLDWIKESKEINDDATSLWTPEYLEEGTEGF